MRRSVLAVVLLVACQDHKPEQPPPPPAPHDGVTLLTPGAAPLQRIRYRLTKGLKATSELVYDFETKTEEPAGTAPPEPPGPKDSSHSGSGSTKPGRPQAKAPPEPPTSEIAGPSPTLVVTLETEVQDVSPDGAAKLRVTVVKTSVRERDGSHLPTDLVTAQAVAAEGVALVETLAPDGEVTEAHIEGAAKLTDKAHARIDGLLQSLEHVAMRLPREPIGAGATWIERKPLPEGGIQALIETLYTLTSITGTTIAYTSVGKVTGHSQTIEQDGTTVSVTNPRGRAETHGTIDLARYALDVASTSTFSAAMTIDAPSGTAGAGASTVAVTVGVKMTPTGEPAAAASAGSSEPPPADPAQGAHKAP
jgi:hypothetical protein